MCMRYFPLLWWLRQSGAAVEHNDVILTNLMMSHCSNPVTNLALLDDLTSTIDDYKFYAKLT